MRQMMLKVNGFDKVKLDSGVVDIIAKQNKRTYEVSFLILNAFQKNQVSEKRITYVMLSWNDDADKLTRDPFLGNVNDFEGYKLFRATDKYFSDAEVITDGYGTPMFLKPIYQCDLVNDNSGFTDFGLVNGTAYNLGDNTGIKHYFRDENVDNGRTYYYAIVAYDYGAPDIGPGISPSENNTVIDIDEYDNIRGIGINVAIVVPRSDAAGYSDPDITLDSLNSKMLGTGSISPSVVSREQLKPGSEYHVTFTFDTIFNELLRPAYYSNPGYQVYNKTAGTIVYNESPTYELTGQPNFSGSNLIYNEQNNHWEMNNNIVSDVFEGIQLEISQLHIVPTIDSANTGWIGDSFGEVNITISTRESKLIPWDCEIVFTEGNSYTSRVESASPSDDSPGIRDDVDTRLWFPNRIILGQSFDFYVVNKSKLDKNGNYTLMDLVVQDFVGSSWNYDGVYNKFQDKVLVGEVDSLNNWKGTAFAIDFFNIDSVFLPKAGDRYNIEWDRNFWITDTFKFAIDTVESVLVDNVEADIKDIRVVPNPYVGTNAMEEDVIIPFLNQPKKIMFANLPSSCVISIFTPSGVKVKTINKNDGIDNGMVYWDLLNEEGLEIAAGMYLYHVRPNFSDNALNGLEHTGKFAVIK